MSVELNVSARRQLSIGWFCHLVVLIIYRSDKSRDERTINIWNGCSTIDIVYWSQCRFQCCVALHSNVWSVTFNRIDCYYVMNTEKLNAVIDRSLCISVITAPILIPNSIHYWGEHRNKATNSVYILPSNQMLYK